MKASLHFLAVFIAACLPLLASAAQPAELRCDSATNPLGIDNPTPPLSWQMRSSEIADAQTAYRIVASSSPALLELDRGDLWDTGKVVSSQSLGLTWQGKPLASGQQVFWKVYLWDRDGRPSRASAVATWTMGLLDQKAWQGARWITDPELLAWVRPSLGYRSHESKPDSVKWVQIDLGAVYPIEAIRLYALQHTVSERVGFVQGFKIEVADTPDMKDARLAVDQTREHPNIWLTRLEYKPAAPVSGRHLRLTATKLRTTNGETCLALSQIAVLSGGKNVAVHRPVTASDSIEQPPYSAQAITDGLGLPNNNARATDTLLLRREFNAKPQLKRALLHVSGLGSYTASLNGQPVTDALLTPSWTDYSKTCIYDTYDVTALVQSGGNAVGLCLAGGMYNVQGAPGRYTKFTTAFRALTAIGLLRLDYSDGTSEHIVTDGSWQVAPGPTTVAAMYSGEDYDARSVQIGWDRPGFKKSGWRGAVKNPAPPAGRLHGLSRSSPPFRLFEKFGPVAMTPLRPGVSVYDMGQNASVMLDLKVRGAAGARVKVIPAELLKRDGSVDRGSVGGGEASWNYTLAGTPGGEEWHPRFFYHGSRYFEVRVEGPQGSETALPTVESINARVVHSDSPPAGEFACSNELFNRIRTLVRWSQRSNFAHVLTDCPHRERLGWLEQYHLNGPSLRHEFDVRRLYAKAFDDIADAQTRAGLVPSTVPEYVIFDGGFRDSPEWGSTIILAAWQHYVWTGDDTALRRHYPVMQRYLAYLDTKAKDRLLNHGLGDWYDQGPDRPGMPQLTPIALSATAIYHLSTKTLGQIAGHLGKLEDAASYEKKASEIGDAFNKAFFNPATGAYATGSQTAQSLPLVLDLVPAGKRPAALAVLLRNIQSQDYAVTAGDIGYRYLLRALGDANRSDVIFRINSQSEKPGYGYQLAHGCTSLAEAWNAERSASQCHFMLGHIIEWFHSDLAGLSPDPGAPGFKNIIMKPRPIGDVTWAKAQHDSPYGPTSVNWRLEGGRFTLEVVVPPNTTATIHVPGRNAEPADASKWVREQARTANEVVYTVPAGRFRFRSEF